MTVIDMDFGLFAERYKRELLENVLPFWLDNSQDKEYGGYFSCLDRDGTVYDTDKFIWLQGREVWMFAMLYNRFVKREEWLDAAVQGAEFLKKFGHDGDYNFYFSLTREGKPLVQPYNIFSNTFACMAFAQLAQATGSDEYAYIAEKTFAKVLERRCNPKGKWEKSCKGTRPLKGFSLPMIICNMILEIEEIIKDKGLIERTIDDSVHEVLDVFYQPDIRMMLENVSAIDNSPVDCFEGRVVNPGHDLEAMWFIMNIGLRKNDTNMIRTAVERALGVIDFGWDKEYGGIFYFMDRKGFPPQQLEWDQKLWWVHMEAAITMLKGYQLTGNEKCLEWFRILDEYMFDRFKDKDFPEWFGYLNRQGNPLLYLKGGKWKGCFHIPRGLYQCYTMLEDLNNNKQR